MAIIPIKPISSLEHLKVQGFSTQPKIENNNRSTFTNVLFNSLKETNQTAAQSQVDSVALATGIYGDDLHNIEIEAVKADLALRTMVSVRNKVLDAYTEIMRMQI